MLIQNFWGEFARILSTGWVEFLVGCSFFVAISVHNINIDNPAWAIF
jgi:hypothetical protein